MTVIVWDGKTLAGDRLSSSGITGLYTNTKLIAGRKGIYGSSGFALIDTLLKE